MKTWRTDAIERRTACIAAGIHRVGDNPNDNGWCVGGTCNTGVCADCLRPVFYGSDDQYHHITDPHRECFLVAAEG
jgi:hypothetical protein